jgi:hypothetical protein
VNALGVALAQAPRMGFQRLKKASENQPISGFCRPMPVAMRLPKAFLSQSPDFTSVPDDQAVDFNW